MKGRPVHAARVVLVVAALVCAACGSRLSTEEVAAAAAARNQRAQGAQGPNSNNPTGTTAVSSTGTTIAGGGGGGGGQQAGGGGGGGEGAAAVDDCVPQGASDVGVTETEIRIGQVATISGPIPGLSQTAVNGLKAYVEYINQTQGGVCGRQLRVSTADDRLDSGVSRAETMRLSSNVFAFAGGWSVVDDGGASALVDTNIPDVGIAISDQRIALSNNFSTSPITLDGSSGTRGILQWMQQNLGVNSAAIVWGAQSTSRNRARSFIAELQSLGFDLRVQREVAITETNYQSTASDIQSSGAELVITTLEVSGIARLAQAFEQLGYRPEVPYYGAQTYGTAYLDLAGSAAEGTILGIAHAISEDAASNPAVATFMEWYPRVNPGQVIDFFSFQGWAAGAMLADALRAAGPAPTRDAVLEALRSFTAYDADGLLAPINPGAKIPATCFLIVTVRGGRWERMEPAGGGFHCD